MKNILNVIKATVLAGVITIFTIIPTMAQDTTQSIQDSTIVNHCTLSNGDVKTLYKDGSYYINSDVNIQSLDYIKNTVTIDKQGQLYSFYVEDIDNYYIDEQINITMNQNNEIVDCIVDSKPVIYNTQIDSLDNNIATLSANGNKYTFINEEGLDGWIVGDKCKAVIQDGRLLEVRPIPLAER